MTGAPRRDSPLAVFLAAAVFIHALGYVWLSHHIREVLQKHGSVVRIRLLREIRPPAPKLKPPPPKPPESKNSLRRTSSKPAPASLRIKQIKFHVRRQSAPRAPSSFLSIPESKQGSAYGNPGGVPGGTENIEEAHPTPAPLPPPPPKPLAPDRRNPAVISRCEPDYPDYEREQGIEGSAGILVTVGKEGEIVNAAVIRSSGNSDLDAAALSSVKRCWKFAPAVQNGRPVETRLTFSITFKLR